MFMKQSSINSISTAVLAAAALSLTGCQDEDFGYEAEKIAFAKSFKEFYPKVDVSQDWNLAERASVTVTPGESNHIKIYAYSDGEYRLVGDYSDVNGTSTLSVDVIEGTSHLLVSDGSMAVEAKVGSSVSLGGFTRTAIPASGSGYAQAGVSVASNYTFLGKEYLDAVFEVLPEDQDIPSGRGGTNLGVVTQNFNFVSTGAFTFYPLYWQSGSSHILGLYWQDPDGTIHTQDIYKDKSGDELAIASFNTGTICNHGVTAHVGDVCTASHKITKVDPDNTKYWTNTQLTCSHDLKWEVGYTCNEGHTITRVDENNIPYTTIDGNEQSCQYHTPAPVVGRHCIEGHLWTSVNGWSKCYTDYVVCSDNLSANVGDLCNHGDVIEYINANTYYHNAQYTFDATSVADNDQTSSSKDANLGSKGITVDLPVGTVFGLYLKVYNDNTFATYNHTTYSEASMNEACRVINIDGSKQATAGWTGKNVKTTHEGKYVFGATFNKEVNGESHKFFCFEDWHLAGPDLNDLVFVFTSTNTPITIDQSAPTWIISAEDLGDTHDIDYNDVVLEVSYISGQQKATVTPLAAGGTLASFVYFNNGTEEVSLGEIHGMFGVSSQTSGSYDPINVSSTRPTTGGAIQQTIDVPANWSLAHYGVDDWNESSQGFKNTNMGGFNIKVVPAGKDATEANATIGGQKIAPSAQGGGSDNVPYVFCTPKYWARMDDATTKTSGKYRWPMESVPMVPTDGFEGSAYNESGHSFASWVANKSTAQDWYKYPTQEQTVSDETPTSITVSTSSTENNNTGAIHGFVPSQTTIISCSSQIVAMGSSVTFNPTSNSSGAFHARSLDESIATVEQPNDYQFKVTGVKAGITKIVISQDFYSASEYDNYSAASIEIDVTVTGTATFSLSGSSVTVGRGQKNIDVTINTNDPDATYAVTSSNSDIATGEVTDGRLVVTGVAPGSTTLTVAFTQSEPFSAPTTTSYQVSVEVTNPQHVIHLTSNQEITIDDPDSKTSQILASCVTGNITYSSNHPEWATVDGNGLVSGVITGQEKDVEITLTVEGAGDWSTATKKVIVHVNLPADYGTHIETSAFIQNIGAPNNYRAIKLTSIPTDKTLTITVIQKGSSSVQVFCSTADWKAMKDVTSSGSNAVSLQVETNSITGDYFICIQNGDAANADIYYKFE